MSQTIRILYVGPAQSGAFDASTLEQQNETQAGLIEATFTGPAPGAGANRD